MHPIKAKRLLKVAEQLDARYPTVAQELRSLVTSALNPPHPRNRTIVQTNFSEALNEALERLEGIPLALAGGLALLHWIDIRTTEDVDFVLSISDFARLSEIFPEGSLKALIYTVNLHGTDVDFLRPDDMPWSEEAIQKAPVQNFMGQQIKVLSPEYLVLYKLVAGRDKDFSDIKALLTLKGIPEKAKMLTDKYLPQMSEDLGQLILEAEYGL